MTDKTKKVIYSKAILHKTVSQSVRILPLPSSLAGKNMKEKSRITSNLNNMEQEQKGDDNCITTYNKVSLLQTCSYDQS